jgi:hypothetical protein
MSSEELRIYNDPAALVFYQGLRDRSARGALISVHHILLEYSYPQSDKKRLFPGPAAPLDELVLYQAVAELFSRWDGTGIDKPRIPDNDHKVLNMDHALAFAQSVESDRARLGLHNLIVVFLGMQLPNDARVDLLFCCRLLSRCFQDEAVFSNIMSGAIAEHQDRLENDQDYWLNTWFGPPK